jgi:signal transduction histidine kinase
VLDRMLVKLIKIAIAESGAQRGCLLLERDCQLEINIIIAIQTISIVPAIDLESEAGRQLFSREVINYVAATQENVVIDRTIQNDLFSQDKYLRERQPTSILCTPLIDRSKRVGILYLENFTMATFTKQQLEILQFLFTQVAISLDNIQTQPLELDIGERTRELTQINDRLQAEILDRQKSEQILRSIVEGTVSATGINFFRSLVRSLAQALGVRYAFISECMDAPPTRVRSFAFWVGKEFGEEFEYNLRGTPCELVIESNSYQCFPDRIQTIFPEEKDEFEAMEAQSYAGIPLLTATGELLGHLAVLNDKSMESNERDRAILEIFAARAAAEMERLQIEKALARLAEIGELAATIVHEVRNPLTTIMMSLNAFKKLELTDRFQEYLNLSLDEADRLERLLSQILLYSRPQTLDRSEIELNSFIAETLDILQTIPVAVGKYLNFSANIIPVNILADRDKLKQVLINLVTNACEAVSTGEAISISIEKSEDRRICISIHNGGTPIPTDILPQLTKPFFTTKASGTGLGLAIVKRIVEAHDGEFGIESSEGVGSIVKVQLNLLSS